MPHKTLQNKINDLHKNVKFNTDRQNDEDVLPLWRKTVSSRVTILLSLNIEMLKLRVKISR